MSYTPPDAHSVILNFDKPLTPVDSHNLILNFGSDAQRDFLNASMKTGFRAVISGSNTEIIINRGQLAATLKAKFQAQISGQNLEIIDNRGTLQVSIKTKISAKLIGINNINHVLGVSLHLSTRFKKAIAALSVTEIPWSKPILRVSNETFFYDRGLVIGKQATFGFEKSETLSRAVTAIHEQTTGLSSSLKLTWQETDKLKIQRGFAFDESIKLKTSIELDWQELVRKRKEFTYSHEVAQLIEKRFSFSWDHGLEIVTKSDIPWQEAKAIHYHKHPVEPWPQPEIPKYVGSTDLNFICLCHDVDSHNVVLNFGVDDCLPAIPNRNWWYILNRISITRLDTGESIKAFNGGYNSSRSNWCWSYTLTVPPTEIPKLEPINDQPVVLRIVVNGAEHHMLYESRTRSRQFTSETWMLKGRSYSALLSADYAPVRSFLQENEKTSPQLCQDELDRIFSDTVLDWQLINELGWIVGTESLTYVNLAPIDAIKMIAESGGGFIASAKNGNQITIKPKYKKSVWDPMTVSDYDVLLPESLVLDHSTDELELEDFNGITLLNPKTGDPFNIKRAGTAGNVRPDTVSNALFDAVSAGGYAKSVLSRIGRVNDHTFETPICPEFSECSPGQTLAFNAEWWGIVDSVSVSFDHDSVTQTITVEEVKRE